MDHTPAYVCSYMGDIFLSILETGQAQSATGVSFSCANLVFCFSFNLPGLKDQEVRRGGLGFKSPSHEDVRKGILSELQQILSPAFLSRIGSPIIFEPVSDPRALGEIARRTIKSALYAITEGLNIKVGEIFMDVGVEIPIVEMVKDSILTFGVRALLEKARSLTTLAFLELYKKVDVTGKDLVISSGDENGLLINLK
ncbi:hypothetical protein FJZ33_06110 [Candidatus Poribacteria bacterium]|nr:hypothetical protein [Candidatus Poribacteria bacterium]